jgi:hypothetical protein
MSTACGAGRAADVHPEGRRRRLWDLRQANPLGSLRKLTLRQVHATSEILVAFTQSGKLAQGSLHTDCKTALGPWVKFASEEVFDRPLVHLGATDEQMEAHRQSMRS